MREHNSLYSNSDVLMSSENTFKDTSRITFNQIPGYCDLGKLT